MVRLEERAGRNEGAEAQEAQALMMRLRQYQTQADALTQELVLVQQSVAEYEKAIETIKYLKKLKAGDELLVSVGAGASVYATLSTPEKVIVNLGAGVSAEKDPDSAIESLRERKEELEKRRAEITETLQRLEQEAQRVQARLQEILARQERPRQEQM